MQNDYRTQLYESSCQKQIIYEEILTEYNKKGKGPHRYDLYQKLTAAKMDWQNALNRFSAEMRLSDKSRQRKGSDPASFNR